MEQSVLSVWVDSNDKRSFETFCSNTGMNVSTAINMFIKAVLREQKLPFEIKVNSYDREIYTKLVEAEKEMDNNIRRYTSEEVLESMKKNILLFIVLFSAKVRLIYKQIIQLFLKKIKTTEQPS